MRSQSRCFGLVFLLAASLLFLTAWDSSAQDGKKTEPPQKKKDAGARGENQNGEFGDQGQKQNGQAGDQGEKNNEQGDSKKADPKTPKAAAGKEAGNIRILLPDAKAKVWFDGSPTTQQGTDRLFYTPPLAAGASSKYRIKASWLQAGKDVVQERDVVVLPGKTVVVDFTKP